MDGKSKSAFEKSEFIYLKAKKQRKDRQLVKAFLYKTKYALLLKEEVYPEVINDFEQEIAEQATPVKQILASIYAEGLAKYYSRNAYRIQRLESHSNRFEEWNEAQWKTKIDTYFQKSLENKSDLLKLQDKDLTDLLQFGGNYKTYQNSLFDLMARRYLRYLKSQNSTVAPKNIQDYYTSLLAVPAYFSVSDTFFQLKIPVSNYQKTLRFYQELEQTDFDVSASLTRLTYTLERLKLVYQEAVLDHKDKLYENSLRALKSQYKGKAEREFISYDLARYYFAKATKQEHPDFYEKSLAEITEILENNKNAEVANLALDLKKSIEKPELKLQTEKYLTANQVTKAKLTYKNADSIYISIYPFSPKRLEDKKNQDSLVRDFVKNNRAETSRDYALKNPQGYFDYTTEILLPELKAGNYLLVFNPSKKKNDSVEDFGYQLLKVSDFTYVAQDFDDYKQFFVAESKTGKPLKDAKIQIRMNQKVSSHTYELKTDRLGIVQFKPNKNDKVSKYKGQVIVGNDSLPLNDFYFSSRDQIDSDMDEDNLEMTTHIITDRGIYRPGQKLYFKGYLILGEGEKFKPAESIKGQILLYNTNYALVDSLDFKTNEFGTFSGHFDLPKTGLNGTYYLEIEPDFEQPEIEKYEDEFDSDEVEVTVEEYKRPNFKVDFDKLDRHYVLGDSVKVKGSAQSFFGGNVANAQVKFSVEQEEVYRFFNQRYIRIPNFAVASGVWQTDVDGKFEIDFPTENLRKDDLNLRYKIAVEITDHTGETQRATQYVSLGNPGLSASLSMPNFVEIGEEEKLSLKIQDLNQVPVKRKGILKIYRLEKPDRIFRERKWEVPEIQQIPKDEFVKYFPHERYDSSEIKQNWKKISVAEIKTNQAEQEFNWDDFPNLVSGEYLVQWMEERNENPIKTEKYFEIKNPNSKQPFQNKILSVNYKVISATSKPQLELEFESTEPLYLYLNLSWEDENYGQKVIALTPGSTVQKMDLPENLDKVNLNYGYLLDNQFTAETERIEIVDRMPKDLMFEVKRFRNKLNPGENEKWELKVLHQDQSPAQAEVLAGMYDASLDEFVDFSWDKNLIDIYNYYPYNNIRHPLSGINYGVKNIYAVDFSWGSDLSKTDLKKFGYDFVNTKLSNDLYLAELLFRKSSDKDKVKGMVLDNQGLPLPGANIEVVGKNRYATTGFDGVFFVKAVEGDLLKVSVLGFESKETRINSTKDILKILLSESDSTLDEVVVMGYSNSVSSKLQGNVAGLNFEALSGAEQTLIVRGVGSNPDGGQPLYILDSKEVSLAEIKALQEEDIIDIEVLKGEAATSIYGVSAKNGVVLVTTQKGGDELNPIKSRENLQETAFFYPDLKTDEQGNIRFTFDSPEALTEWKFQAFAHTKDMQKAYLKLKTITQKDLNIIPNFPRFFRAGDRLTLTAKIANLSDVELFGNAQLKFVDEVTGKEVKLVTSSPIKNFKVAGQSDAYVEWELEIPENLTAVRYEIAAKSGNFTDAETNLIPVLTHRELVTETLAFWLNPQEEKDFVLEGLKKNTSESLQHQSLVLNYTSNPAWTSLQVLPVIAQTSFRISEQAFARYYSLSVAEKILKENPKIAKMLEEWKLNKEVKSKSAFADLADEIPWLVTTYSLEEQQKELADLLSGRGEKIKENLMDLQKMQLNSGGFPWFEAGNENETISIHILSGLGRVGKPENLDLQKSYDQILTRLTEYLDNAFLKRNKTEARINRSSDLHYLYARSFFEKPKDSLQKAQMKVYHNLKENWLELSLRNKITLGIISKRMGETDFAQKIVESLQENAVINSVSGMYWKENKPSWYWYEAPIATQALAIELFSEMGESNTNINALKTWLLKQKRLQAWQTTRATTDAIYALLLDGTDLVADQNAAQIKIGEKVFDIDTQNNPAGLFQTKFEANEISTDLSEISIHNQSNSPQYGGLYWQYFEDADKIQSSGLPELKLEKQLYVEKVSSTGKQKLPIEETQIEVGDKIIVRLTLKLTEDFEFIELSDARPSGLEPVDVLSGYRFENGLRFYQVTKDSGTYFFFDRIRKGNYELEYELNANNTGDFSSGAAELKSLYAPEFSAKTKGGRIKINPMK